MPAPSLFPPQFPDSAASAAYVDVVSSAPPSPYTWLHFNSPLSPARAAGMVDRLARSRPSTVLDLGCGWGELLLQLLVAAPGAVGVGVDTDTGLLARGRGNAEARGLADRVEFVASPVADFVRTAGTAGDLTLCVGSSHVFSDAAPPAHTVESLRALREMAGTGGRVLFGEGFWQRPPTAGELAGMWPDTSSDEFTDLAGLVALAAGAGFRPLWIETASMDEWEHFESAYLLSREEWLAAHGDHAEADTVRAALDTHRSHWLAYRGILGFAYLTLLAC
ncbi:class I SAM-dependent methyltransferase [Streptomyces sp. 150FB]|uniref:SAM-dependent methyltransferase n=1 Tax=Streptomyces sp. 150FB TaxID=1576605 RepID=UPI00099DB7F8|nr:class I SAM-dependent methyltransferase [Streptomyces sp. 150FB]